MPRRIEGDGDGQGPTLSPVDCAATRGRCKKPECMRDGGTHCRLAVQNLAGMAGEGGGQKHSTQQFETRVTQTARELGVSRRKLRNTIRNLTSR